MSKTQKVRFWMNFVSAVMSMLVGVAIGLDVRYAVIPLVIVAGVLIGVSACYGD